ncbi:MAG TPA: tol-pal system-associated acyl-CoA thioesterase [Thermohalobaculum sp.]|nr:tol-pal system-associated acyl-CoA thioesterase [Thermohalobaculum sp.]
MSGAPPHRHPVRVYYEDTDLAGIVYYANYLKFLERGRTEALRNAGVDQGRLREERGIVFAVRRVAIEYLRPARLDDLLTVTTAVTWLRGASVEMRQGILRGDVTLVTADVTVAAMTLSGRPARLSPELRAVLTSLPTG